MERITGTVEFFKDDKGFGFIRPDSGDKDVFVHHSVIMMDGFKTLKRGDKVEFEIVEDAKGPRANNVRRAEGGNAQPQQASNDDGYANDDNYADDNDSYSN
jgi:CspA family cold shock protein